MQAKLIRIGRSVGLTIPAKELKVLSARAGDTVEVQITKMKRCVREGWDNPQLWLGADEEPLYLENTPGSGSDYGEQWPSVPSG